MAGSLPRGIRALKRSIDGRLSTKVVEVRAVGSGRQLGFLNLPLGDSLAESRFAHTLDIVRLIVDPAIAQLAAVTLPNHPATVETNEWWENPLLERPGRGWVGSMVSQYGVFSLKRQRCSQVSGNQKILPSMLFRSYLAFSCFWHIFPDWRKPAVQV